MRKIQFTQMPHARRHTVTGDELVSTKNEHKHDVRPGKIEANQIMHQMKEEARQQIVPVNSSIIASCLQEAVQLSLPITLA